MSGRNDLSDRVLGKNSNAIRTVCPDREEHMEKQDILAALRSGDDYVSGQQLCEKFHVSRTAVWKRIKQLQEEGYEIEAVSNRGYRIVSSPDILTEAEIESALTTRWIGRKVLTFACIDSTNTLCRKKGEEGWAEGLLVVADEQTGGKGRRGRSWNTPRGSAIAMSLLLRPEVRPERIAMVTLVAGMALAKACRRLYDLPAEIKWPNDVVIGGKKLSGTLTEMSAQMSMVNYIVVGTGINVNVEQFPEELSRTATSLYLETGKKQNRARLLAEVLNLFEGYYEQFLRTEDLSQLQEEYNDLLVSAGKTVRVLDPAGEFEGISQGINAQGELLVETQDGTLRSVYAGEVSVRGVYGYV